MSQRKGGVSLLIGTSSRFVFAKCLDMISAGMVAFQHFRMSYAFLQPRYLELEVASKSVSL